MKYISPYWHPNLQLNCCIMGNVGTRDERVNYNLYLFNDLNDLYHLHSELAGCS